MKRYLKAAIDIMNPTSTMSMGIKKKKIKAKVRKGDIYDFDDDSNFLYLRVTDRIKIDKRWFIYYNMLGKDMIAISEYCDEDGFKQGLQNGHMTKCGELDALHNKDVAKFLLLGL